MAKLGWGVVGLGNIVEKTMAPGMVDNPDSELVAFTSRDKRRAEAFAEQFGASFAYDDYAEMLTNPAVEAVLIETPNALHAEQVIAAAQAGKHVLCDKPMATTVQDAVREVEACAAAGVYLGVNFHNRQLPWIVDVRRMIAEGAIGEVGTIQVEVSAGHRGPKSWRNDPELAGGLGTTYNIGVHAFDFLRFLLDADPVEVVALFDDENGAYAVETEALALMRFSNGTRVYVNSNQSSAFPQNDIAIFGSRGRIVGNALTRSRSDGTLTVRTADGETTTAYAQPDGLAHHQSEAAFTRAVLRGEQPTPSGIDGLHSALLCDAIKRSAEERRVVDISYDPVHNLRVD
jgi:1,5-anhydro-D-fructose reductase (1,5-anhydro-D-mannitol-forming)